MDFSKWILAKLVRGYISTIRLERYGELRENVFYLFWHAKLLVVPRVLRGIRGSALVSPSRDGQYVAALVREFGFGVIESSYRKERFRGAVEMLRRFQRGEAIGITPDGPIGPPGVIKRELYRLLHRIDAPVGFVGIGYSRFYRANSWDRFQIPLPFSRAVAMIEYRRGSEFSSHEDMGRFLHEVNLRAEALVKK